MIPRGSQSNISPHMFVRAESSDDVGQSGAFRPSWLGRLPLRPVVVGWAATVLTAALGESVLVALHGPLDLNVWAVRTLLLMVPLVVVAVGLVVALPLRLRLRATGSDVRIGQAAGLVLLFFGWGAALWVTEWESSVALRSARGMALLGLFGGSATVLALAGGWLASRSSLMARIGALRFAAAAATLLAVVCFHVGRNMELAPFWPLRMLNVVLDATLMLAAAALLRKTGVLGGWAWRVGSTALVLAAVVASRMPPKEAHATYARIVLDAGSERRVLMHLRHLLDRDGDGFTVWLDGGGCDEQNPDARPLGPIDCTKLLGHDEPPSPPPDLTAIPQVSRVLLLTVDTWRCELRGNRICPRLDALAPTASYAGEQRPFMAVTARSLGALFGAPYRQSAEQADARPAPTITAARAAGYDTKALYTVAMFRAPSMGGAFAEHDESLLLGPIGETVNSGALTGRLLDDLRAHKDDPGKRLVWTHYMDPHSTYVPTAEGEPVPFFLFDRRGAYIAEVKRVEAHVADVVEEARRLGYDRDAAIIVTSDHGESFSHGRLYHSTSSYDTEMKIPLFAWIYDKEGRLLKLNLPRRTEERSVASLLAHLVGAPPPEGQSAISVTDPKDGDIQYLVVDDGWKLIYHHQAHYEELYYLDVDPREDNDLSQSEPEHLARMQRRLGAELGVLFPAEKSAQARR